MEDGSPESMVVSQNWGTPIQTPKDYNPYYGDFEMVP